MSNPSLQSNSNDDEIQARIESEQHNKVDDTADSRENRLEQTTLPDLSEDDAIRLKQAQNPLPEDYMKNIQARKYRYHKLDSGMVEVSLALAGLVFTVATISNNLSDLPMMNRIFLVFLVLATHVVALWFLATYCVQHELIEGERNESWHNPLTIFGLLKCVWTDRKERRAGIYPWLAWCIILLVVTFVMSI